MVKLSKCKACSFEESSLVHELQQKMVDKYVSIPTDETGALEVQTETCIQVDYEA